MMLTPLHSFASIGVRRGVANLGRTPIAFKASEWSKNDTIHEPVLGYEFRELVSPCD